MKEQEGATLTKEEEVDANLATAMGATALYVPEMQEAIVGLAQSADPVMVAGQLVANLVVNVKEQSMTRGLDLSDKIWLADGGVADRLADELCKVIDATTGQDMDGMTDKVWIEALNVLKMMNGGPQQGRGQGAPETAPQPAGGAPMGPPANIMGQLGGMA